MNASGVSATKLVVKPLSRRQFLLSGAALAVPWVAGCGRNDRASPVDGAADSAPPKQSLDAGFAVQFKAPGVVVEVLSQGAVANDQIQAAPVRQMMTRGMCDLTGQADERDAWRSLFSADDIVGIKISPLGYPEVFSHVETVAEVIRGLNLAGVPNGNIVVFERYRQLLDPVGYPALLPPGVRFASAVDVYTTDQSGLSGYDPNQFVDLARVYPGADPNDPNQRRSCLCQLVSQQLTKVVNIPALKDHISAGLTFALKNITYGLVNNVSRSHVLPDNWTKDFLPAIAAMSTIRDKVVLHIGDALRVCYDGGPGPLPDGNFKSFTYSSLLFSTDPVAMDRVGWDILDTRRAAAGLPPIAECGLQLINPGHEAANERQPQYVLAAGDLGLGVADIAAIQHRRYAL